MTPSVDQFGEQSPQATRRRLWLPIGGILAVCLTAATAFGLTSPKVYEARAQVELLAPGSINTSDLRSIDTASHVVNALSLLDRDSFLQAHPSLIARGDTPQARQLRAALIVLDSSTATISTDGSLASITYQAANADLSAEIANGLAQAVIENSAGGQSADVREALETLLVQLEAETETFDPTAALADETAVSPSPATPAPVDDVMDALNRDALAALRNEMALVRGELASVEAAMETGGPDASNPNVARMLESRSALEEEYERITRTFRADYPAAKDITEQIAAIDAALAREELRQIEDLALEARQLRQREVDITAQINEVIMQSATGTEDQEPDLAQTDDDAALHRLLTARLAQDRETAMPATARIASEARVPQRPISPDWGVLIGLALGAALLLSVGVFALDHRRQIGG